ncbi:hypothetical protein N7U49_03995 [Streptomyces sp. AD2-2]|nr:hypothetical protein N7U49_03995 [Streptomyces sp. AD2-2]
MPLPSSLTAGEQAYYLQGTFFNTAVVQMSEATAHLLLALATHRPVQDRLVAGEEEPGFLDGVVNETLQHFPLFGVAHRITSGEIPAPGRTPSRPAPCCSSTTPSTRGPVETTSTRTAG